VKEEDMSYQPKLFSAFLVALFCSSALGQTSKTAATPEQIQEVLKAHPDLKTGIKASDGSVARVVTPIKGGLRYEIKNSSGHSITADVVGPPTTIVTRNIIDYAIELIRATEKADAGTKSCGNVTVTVGGTGNTGTTTTVTVNCN
jgi:hypothetical protein